MRLPTACTALVLVSGCGRVGFDGSTSTDASVTLGTFSTPVLVPGLESRAGDDPTLTGDMLEIVFEGSGSDLWSARRNSVDEPWGTPVLLTELNTAMTETTPEMTYDGLTLVFARGDEPARATLYTTRASRLDPWGAPVPLPAELDYLQAVSPSPDGSPLMVGTDGGTLYFGQWDGVTWGPFAEATELDMHLRMDGGFLVSPREVWFNAGPSNLELGIWRATRSDPSAPFDQIERVPELDLAQDDVDPWLSPDGRVVVFASRVGSSPRFYMATR